jgi:hypothetical protein
LVRCVAARPASFSVPSTRSAIPDIGAKREDEHGAVIGEADQARLKRGIPQRRQEQPVVQVQTVLVRLALSLGNDVGGS